MSSPWKLFVFQVNNGILGCDAGREGALCYARDITQLEGVTDTVDAGSHGTNVWRYMDVDDNNAVKKDNQRRQRELRQEVKAHGVPTREYSVGWVRFTITIFKNIFGGHKSFL